MLPRRSPLSYVLLQRRWPLADNKLILSDLHTKKAKILIESSKGSSPNFAYYVKIIKHFQDGGRYHIETSPLICRANQWTGFYMITASVLKELSE